MTISVNLTVTVYWSLKGQTLQSFDLNHKDGTLLPEDKEQTVQVKQWEDAINQQENATNT